ncbi:acyltransferase family protein [Microbacterium flavum]|uniref:acyltransferase family protein n=1 Tax=Microbacterium flavum TaxID=415216 RepID=UPI0024ACE78E|nr:acyltransferase family protein [Microbacterium flavum]
MTSSLAQTAARGGSADAPGSRAFRSDIQALRAVAITAVVLNHLWPTRFSGGYVGVDVFFVISGFLITAHLFGEVARTGGIRLGRFYARRIRRLLPAALLVLAVTAGLVAAFLPYARWSRNAIEIIASATYVENWTLAAMSVNYSALNDAASAAQHFWSLSVEEQFYLVWPILMLGAVWAASRLGRPERQRTVILVTLAAVACASLVSSIVYTAAHPAPAYFATFTRAWEFALGGLVALGVSRLRAPQGLRYALIAAGLGLIVYPVFAFGPATPFPGSAALLPAIGTAAVIAAGSLGARTRFSPVFEWRPVQWVGDVSYSLYLWHWPLIVVAPFVLGRELSGPIRIAILAVALVLAWATRRWVEKPAQTWPIWSGSVRRAVTGMAAGWAVIAVLVGLLLVGSAVRSAADAPSASPPQGSCAGPNALVAQNDCPDPFGPAGSVEMGPKNEYFYTPPECGEFLDILRYGDTSTTHRCDFSGGDAGAPDVWLVGDSHAQQWQGPLFDLAREHGWRVTISFIGGCPVADVAYVGFRSPGTTAAIETCRRWNHDLAQAITADVPDLVVTSMAARHELVDDGSGTDATTQYVAGLQRTWAPWTEAGSRILVIADPPYNGEVRSPDCVALNTGDPAACARPRSEAQPADPLVAAVSAVGDPRVALFDPTPYLCDDSLCYGVVGGIPAYYDADHLNLEYARLLAPMIEAALPLSP